MLQHSNEQFPDFFIIGNFGQLFGCFFIFRYPFQLLYVESGFLSVAYLMVASLVQFGISVRCQVSAKSQYLVRLLSLCQISGGQTIHSIERLLTPISTLPTSLRNFASKVAGLQMHANTLSDITLYLFQCHNNLSH